MQNFILLGIKTMSKKEKSEPSALCVRLSAGHKLIFMFWKFLYQLLPTMLLLLLSRFSRVQLCVTPQTAAYQAPRPWDSPGKNTGVDCHFLLQRMEVKSQSEATQSCPTLRNPMDCSLPGSSVYGIFQARVLEWGAIAFSSYCVKGIITETSQAQVTCILLSGKYMKFLHMFLVIL